MFALFFILSIFILTCDIAQSNSFPKSSTTLISVSSKIEKSSNFTKSIFSKVGKNGEYQLTYYGLMLSGAVARSVAATAVQPLTLIKTMLQKRHGKMPEISFKVLTRGSGTQFIMSVPHGALNFAVTEVRLL